ncbi:molybdenum cofactor guanylyltransferase [Motilimonas eburnea]|uniref:molybdenum cofactor guanylyltransferase n=1 Tax=Motilimonas eburnea TaxID=1737488 RepID=UPI001E315742|nr:molybdenum cofactor guanylyltransferase [Motilimonas eburnea]MCE2570102.1 molybdenum cofactor guanylyltransferase [Motilimonas eburnea]
MSWATNEISAVILAGGKSSRMGRDKALLPRGGKTQLAHCFNLLTQMQLGELKVSGHYLEYPHLRDIESGIGPLGGIATALAHAAVRCRALLVVPVDMPLLTPQDIDRLLTESNELGGYYQGALFPLLLAITPSLEHTLKQVLANPNAQLRSLRTLLKQIDIQEIVPDREQKVRLMNANTPAQWLAMTAEK